MEVDGSSGSANVSTAAFLSSAPPALSQYVSCIKVDGRPILPPVMTEEKRAEMRKYREIAVLRQKERQKIRDFEDFASSVEGGGSSSICDEDIEDGEPERPLTSTPMKKQQDQVNLSPENSACSSDLENLPKSSASGSSSSEDEESSASTGTFIIRRKQGDQVTQTQEEQQPDPIEVEVESDGPISPSVILYTKRKRPAKYFDTKDEEQVGQQQVLQDIPQQEQQQQQQQQLHSSVDDSSFASTTLSKYIIGCGGGAGTSISYSPMSNVTTPGDTASSNRSFSQVLLPNSVPSEEKEFKLTSQSSSSSSPSGPEISPFKINTDFLSLSKLSLEDKTDNRSPPLRAVRKSGRKKFFESPERADLPETPSSAKVDVVNEDEEEGGSDKENIIQDLPEDKTLTLTVSVSRTSSHVRKLSYTLTEPSEALLSAGLQSPPTEGIEISERFPLSPIPQSAPTTPNVTSNKNNKTYDYHSADSSAHLFQGEGSTGPADTKDGHGGRSSPGLGNGEALEKLEELMSRYEEEALKMKSLFEAEKVKILQEIGQAKGQQIEQSLIQQENSPAPVILDLSTKKSKDRLIVTGMTSDSHQHPLSASSSSSVILSETSNLRNFFHPISHTASSIPESPPNRKLTNTFDINNSHVGPSAASPRVTSSGLALLQSIRGQKRPSSKPANLPDAASPLLKGLVIPPEETRQTPKQLPTKPGTNPIIIDESLNKNLCKISATAKGFLVRRLLNTERVQTVIATIRDTVALLLSLYDEHKLTGKGTPDDELHRRLLQQLTSACTSFHDVFFKLTTHERMAIISNDREKLKAKALNMKMSSSQGSCRKLSEATMKSLERRLTQDKSPAKSKTTSSKTWRRKTTAASHGQGSLSHRLSHRDYHRQSFLSNSNSININTSSASTSISNDIRGAMKRRRLSTAASTAYPSRDTNGNSGINKHRPSTTTGALTFDRAQPTTTVTPREFLSARQPVLLDSSWGSTTFVIPNTQRLPSSRIPSNSSNNPRLSSRMSVSSSNSTPSSRAPWKK